MKSRSFVARAQLAFLLLGGQACGSLTASGVVAGPPPPPPIGSSLAQGDCKVGSSGPQLNPWLLGWEHTERLKLKPQAARTPIVVTYDGCSMKVLEDCRPKSALAAPFFVVPNAYQYVGASYSSRDLHIESDDDLRANIPLGLATFRSQVGKHRRLSWKYANIGSYSFHGKITTDQLEGDACKGATHVVKQLDVGAAQYSAASGGSVGASAGAAGSSADGNSESSASTAESLADLGKCGGANTTLTAPPLGCDALLKVQIAPIEKAPTCPEGTAFIPGGVSKSTGTTSKTETIERFCLDIQEVSVASYRKCVNEGACSAPVPNPFAIGNYFLPDREAHPMNAVNQRAAGQFCAWKKQRLPTSAEWGWAAGGSVATPYPWGTLEPGATDGCFLRPSTCPVGSSKQDKSPQGVFDLGGNVAEWTSDRMMPPPTLIEYGVVRGANWRSINQFTLSQFVLPELQHDFIGFRCAAAPK